MLQEGIARSDSARGDWETVRWASAGFSGRGTVSYYRLYFMHPFSGHIERFAEFEAPDDHAAIALAREHFGDHPLELWCEGHKVARIEALAIVAAYHQDAA